ncbi:ring finger [Stylonychia lemnae]|uniref:Ring finger n=1 Tax=Stylonychia lemnae TaxID=5949 RepID=A0A078AZ57_STYLE|nr:ring finger [Stylonychia lemnae]|eukprot:CDW86492.1 ring finger [Stylonychia lemnae]
MQQSINRKRIALAVTSLIDICLFISLIVFLSVFLYQDPQARTLWKVGLTCNSIVLLFEIRMRLFCCFGYPLKDMRRIGCCIEFTRIRMKLADYFCFFYIFFSEMINASVLVMKQYKSNHERIMFITIVTMNAIYLVFWIIFTKGKSFHRFPKEKQRANDQQSTETESVDQSNTTGDHHSTSSQGINTSSQFVHKRKLNKSEAILLVKQMPKVDLEKVKASNKNAFNSSLREQLGGLHSDKEGIIESNCAICLDNLMSVGKYPEDIKQDIEAGSTSRGIGGDYYPSQDIIEEVELADKKEVKQKSQRFKRFFAGIKRMFDKITETKSKIRAFPECQHLYHEKCLIQWIQENDSCPMCRRKSSCALNDDQLSDDEVDDDLEDLLFAGQNQNDSLSGSNSSIIVNQRRRRPASNIQDLEGSNNAGNYTLN